MLIRRRGKDCHLCPLVVVVHDIGGGGGGGGGRAQARRRLVACMSAAGRALGSTCEEKRSLDEKDGVIILGMSMLGDLL